MRKYTATIKNEQSDNHGLLTKEYQNSLWCCWN